MAVYDTPTTTLGWPLRPAKTTAIDMLLLGKTGTGKSATGNSILGREIFKTSIHSTSETAHVKSEWSIHTDDDGRHYDLKVTDGPGLEDTNLNSLQDRMRAYINIGKVLSECPHGIHAFLVVVKIGGRFTKEDENALKSLKEILGQDFLCKFGVIIFTYGNQLRTSGMTFPDWCREQSGDLGNVIHECNNRCVLFENLTDDGELKKEQLNTLLDLVLEIISSNNGERYTNERFKTHTESHKRLMEECGLTCVKEIFRKQLSILEGEVHKITDKKSEKMPTLVAQSVLENLLGQVKHELEFTPKLERLQNDLLEVEKFLKEIERLKENGKPYKDVLKKSTTLCEKMVTRASPPLNPEWLEWVFRGVSVVSGGLTLAGAVGGPVGLTIAGTVLTGVNVGARFASIVALKVLLKDKY